MKLTELRKLTGEHPFTEADNDGNQSSEQVNRRRLANHAGELKKISGLATGSKQLMCVLTWGWWFR
jgi:hypothetical protein